MTSTLLRDLPVPSSLSKSSFGPAHNADAEIRNRTVANESIAVNRFILTIFPVAEGVRWISCKCYQRAETPEIVSGTTHPASSPDEVSCTQGDSMAISVRIATLILV